MKKYTKIGLALVGASFILPFGYNFGSDMGRHLAAELFHKNDHVKLIEAQVKIEKMRKANQDFHKAYEKLDRTNKEKKLSPNVVQETATIIKKIKTTEPELTKPVTINTSNLDAIVQQNFQDSLQNIVIPDMEKSTDPSERLAAALLMNKVAGGAESGISLKDISGRFDQLKQLTPEQEQTVQQSMIQRAEEYIAKSTQQQASKIQPSVTSTSSLVVQDKVNPAQKKPVTARNTVMPKIGFDSYGNPITSQQKANQIKVVADKLPAEYTVNYPARGEKKGEIFVFTDPTCKYCQKFHKDIQQFQNDGYEVRYLYYPRVGIQDTSPRGQELLSSMMQTWCSEDPAHSVNLMYSGMPLAPANCDAIPDVRKKIGNAVQQHYILGSFFNVNATPTFFANNGMSTAGYSNANRLKMKLGLE